MNHISRRNFLQSGFWLFAGLVMGRAASIPEGVASHPPEYERAPVPDLAGEITTEECLTRDQIERVHEMAIERACPVEQSMDHAQDAFRYYAHQVNPPVLYRGAPIIRTMAMEPGEIIVLDQRNFIETWNREQAHAANSLD